MDDTTKGQMETPRCGVTDKIKQNSTSRSKRHIVENGKLLLFF